MGDYRIEVIDGAMIGAPFSHSALANVVGATRQWVTVGMKRYETAGVTSVRGSRGVLETLKRGTT